jgi:DNA-binding CsgD family transcriptional regulator
MMGSAFHGSSRLMRERLEELRELCLLSGGHPSFIPTVTRLIGSMIPNAHTCFLWFDQSQQMQSFTTAPDLADQMRRCNELASQLSIDEQRTALDQLLDPSPLTNTQRYARTYWESPFYREATRKLHAEHMMMTKLRPAAGPPAFFGLARDRRSIPFSDRDEARALAIAPYVTFSMEPRQPVDQEWATGLPGMVIVKEDGRLLHATEQGLELLYLAFFPSLPAGNGRLAQFYATQLRPLCERLVDFSQGAILTPPLLEIRTLWGHFRLRADWLKEQHHPTRRTIAVSIEQSLPGSLMLFPQLRTLSLSPRQTTVVTLAVQGWSVPQIASRLQIAPSSVITHLRRVYDRMGVSNQAQLRDLVLSRTAPAVGR